MHFAWPDILDGNLLNTAHKLRHTLGQLRGPLTLHGPFYDMSPGSIDERINELTRTRFEQALRSAAELGAIRMIVHANFLAPIRNDYYRTSWHERNVAFWGSFGEVAQRYGVVIAIENMWEFEPAIIANLLREVNHPYIKACLDVGHSHIYSDEGFTLEDWLEALQPWLVHTHLNNNNGKVDEHHGFDYPDGVLDYHAILPKLRALPHPPTMVMEMDTVAEMRDSLYYFNLK